MKSQNYDGLIIKANLCHINNDLFWIKYCNNNYVAKSQ